MSRLDIKSPSRAQTVVDNLYRDVERRIAAGDEKARMVYDAMLYTAAKSIGALAAAADGRIDRIILTGGIAHSQYVTDYLTQKVGFIAPVEVMAGEFEMEALAAGASRVLAGQETPHRFRDLLRGGISVAEVVF